MAADFVTKTYSAFGTTVSVTPAWPNTTDNRVQQMIDRGAGNDNNWDNADGDIDLTDFDAFATCMTVPDAPYAAGCSVFDFDFDADADLHDYGAFHAAFTGQSP